MVPPTVNKRGFRLMDTIVGYVSPFILAAIIGLATWIAKIDDRQYNNAQTYATKVELKEAINDIKIEVNTRFEYSEKNQKLIIDMIKEKK